MSELREASRKAKVLVSHALTRKTDATRRSLLAYIAELEADASRLNALERFAMETNDKDGFADDFASLSTLEDGTEPEFTVSGPRTAWGRRTGFGPTLRAAIDRARSWDGASNLNDLGSSEPARSVSSEG